jgi:MIP family channel proteins
MRRYARLLLSEWLATYVLVAAGSGAIAVENLTHKLGHGGVAAAFGLVVVVIIYAFGDSSGAHANPAVTIGFWAAGRLPGRLVLPYAAAQSLGALAASASIAQLLPGAIATGLGGTHSRLPTGATWFLEAALTVALMLLVLRVSVGAREKGITAGLAVGAMVALEALVAGPLTGASMNPVRSLGPAVVSGQLAGLWVYLTAPVGGALAAVALSYLLEEPNQPST